MDNKLILPNKDGTEDNVAPLRLVTGGKGGDGNWLNNLDVGTVFVCNAKPDGRSPTALFCEQYEVVQKEANNFVKLYAQMQGVDVWTRSHIFCMARELGTILGTVEQ